MTDILQLPDRGTTFDPILILASGLDSIPGSHAVLLGAGVSIAAGVPSAWGVQQEIIRKLAAADRTPDPEDPHAWYREKFGREASYEGLLAEAAPTQHGRQALLRAMFEPDRDDPSKERPRPTIAHTSLASLAATGAVRVFLTLNFDHLMEQALRSAGIEPTVVRTTADLYGLAPLHTLQAVVVHLHGDYLTATSMLNTTDELESYDPELVNFLQSLLHDHALLAVGWSAEYDSALRPIVRANLSERFASYWITRDPLGELASELAVGNRITHLLGDADEQNGRLADAYAAITTRQARHPLTLLDAVSAMKRQLAGRPPAIDAHDRLRAELASLRDLPALSAPAPLVGGDYGSLAAQVDEAAAIPAGLVAAAAYWGAGETDAWWLTELPRFAARNRGSGSTDHLELPMRAGTMLYQAAAVGAAASQRFNLLYRLLASDAGTGGSRPESLAQRLAAARNFVFGREPSAVVQQILRPIFVKHLALGWRAYEAAWELHDLLLAAQSVLDHPDFETRTSSLVSAEDALQQKEEAYQASGQRSEDEQTARNTAWQDAGRARGRLADLAEIWGCHIRADRDTDAMISPAASTLVRQLETDGEAHPLMRAGFAGGRASHLITALNGVSHAVGMAGRDRAREALPPGQVGVIPQYLWIDTGEVPGF